MEKTFEEGQPKIFFQQKNSNKQPGIMGNESAMDRGQGVIPSVGQDSAQANGFKNQGKVNSFGKVNSIQISNYSSQKNKNEGSSAVSGYIDNKMQAFSFMDGSVRNNTQNSNRIGDTI
jgi:hypothetical protein